MTTEATRILETALEQRFGGTARLTPSCRLGLIAALRAFFEPGDRLAMISPLCEVVGLSTLAAGLTPVFVDSQDTSPTIDVDALQGLEPDGIRGVLATNLYGLPEALVDLRELCDRRGWTLIEDAAQILDSRAGDRCVGTFGDATVISFKKYFDEACGAVLCRKPDRQVAIDTFLAQRTERTGVKARARARILKLARGAGLGRLESSLRGASAPRTVADAPTPQNTRVALSRQQLLSALQSDDPVEGMHEALSMDDPAYRTFPPPAQLERLAAKVAGWDRLADELRASGARLRAAASEAGARVVDSAHACLLAVPALFDDRDGVVAHLWRTERLRIENIYNPPLTDWLPKETFVDLRAYPQRDLRWSRHLVPLPSAQAERCGRGLRGYRQNGKTASLDPSPRDTTTRGPDHASTMPRNPGTTTKTRISSDDFLGERR